MIRFKKEYFHKGFVWGFNFSLILLAVFLIALWADGFAEGIYLHCKDQGGNMKSGHCFKGVLK